MKQRLLLPLLLPLLSSALLAGSAGSLTAGPQPPETAAAAIAAAIRAIGGEGRLTSLRGIRVEAIGHQWALEQSERPEGPWLAQYTQRTELRDAKGQRMRRQSQTRDWNFPKWWPEAPPAVIVAGGAVAMRSAAGTWRPGSPADLADAEEVFALSPERMLLTAREAKDLKLGPRATLQGIPNYSLTFTWRTRPVTLYFNVWTHRATMMEVVREDRFGVWGDVTERRWYGWWDLQKGLWYPRQVTTEWNGFPFSDVSTTDLEVDAHLDDAEFAIPAETVAAFGAVKDRPFGLARLALDESKAIAVAPDVVLLAGNWNVLLVRQRDGIVVFEAPISSAYSQAVVDVAAKRFPGVPVKAVVTTSDAWPHIGGIREYIARKIPVYALDLNVAILDRLSKAARSQAPDSLSVRPARPTWRPVTQPTTIGGGDLRIQLIPVRGELGERMMIAYLPGLRLAYSSDLIQRGPGGSGFFMPAMLTEVVAAFAREPLGTPDQVVGMHLTPTRWSEVEAAVRESEGR